jgi:DNA polymerase III subunit beta
MKLSTSKDNFLKIIQVVHNIVNPRSNLPILSNILLEAYEKTVRLTATDLDIGISCVIDATVTEQGSITLPAKRLSDIVRELPGAEVTINTKKNLSTTIESGQCEFRIMGLAKDEFPKLPEFKNKEALTIDQNLLKEMITLTSFAVSHDETRYVLNGAMFKIAGGKFSVIATDGRRLAFATKPLGVKYGREISIVVPLKTIHELSRNLKDDGDVTMLLDGNQALFDLGNLWIVSRLIEGEFPDYQNVIPAASAQKVQCNRDEFLGALRRASLLATPDYQAVKLELFPAKGSNAGRLVVSKSTPDVGESKEELSVTYEGKALAIGFNPNYLIDALKNLHDAGLELELTDPGRPGVIRKEDYIYIVLPMRLE